MTFIKVGTMERCWDLDYPTKPNRLRVKGKFIHGVDRDREAYTQTKTCLSRKWQCYCWRQWLWKFNIQSCNHSRQTPFSTQLQTIREMFGERPWKRVFISSLIFIQIDEEMRRHHCGSSNKIGRRAYYLSHVRRWTRKCSPRTTTLQIPERYAPWASNFREPCNETLPIANSINLEVYFYEAHMEKVFIF